ncbi:CPP1-like family protein [Chlorogloea sp. CCALA 695]|uniref:CPP1-like family protein n=1 Tax=Chlorogloea sp. CCALA 695 TaxID=2107693 RepID=UPI000D06E9D4|nr:CPP1-like family protein [Chlorogloea sp. CCALA 695]PSB33311.1 molecular chaperone DnaJ [Chlorogloea sp. CCALA 695]
MSEPNHYEKLGLKQDATFDQIQEARNRLATQYNGDSQHLNMVEEAYDAILMERLRMRQEGKIKVPEGIKFAERLSQPPQKQNQSPKMQSPSWLEKLRDRPSPKDILLPGGLFLSLSGLSVVYPTVGAQLLQVVLMVGVCLSIYFIRRKEQNFSRAILITGAGLIVGLVVGGLLANLLISPLNQINIQAEQFSTVVTFVVLWLVSSFLR